MAEQAQKSEPTTAVSIHLSFSRKGGAGKSLFTMTLAEYLSQKKRHYTIIDTDSETPDVAQAYTPEIVKLWGSGSVIEATADPIAELMSSIVSTNSDLDPITALMANQIVFSDDDRAQYKTMNLLSIALAGKKANKLDTLVNLPANAYNSVCDFIASNQLHKSKIFRLCNWWISNGSPDSIDLFLKAQAKFPEANHILVLNKGCHDYVHDWRNYRVSAEVATLYKEGKIKIAMLPFLCLDPKLWNSIKGKPLSELAKDDRLDVLVQGAIETWLLQAFSSIEATKVI